jgi:hypothetical protein
MALFLKNKVNLFILLGFIGYWISGFGISASAAFSDYKLEMPLLSGQEEISASPGEYVKMIFTYGIAIVGVLALFAVAYGGIRYMLSGSSETGKSEGKRWIFSALAGLSLLLCSYLILSTINPQLAGLNIDSLKKNIIGTQDTVLNNIKPVSSLSPQQSIDIEKRIFLAEIQKCSNSPREFCDEVYMQPSNKALDKDIEQLLSGIAKVLQKSENQNDFNYKILDEDQKDKIIAKYPSEWQEKLKTIPVVFLSEENFQKFRIAYVENFAESYKISEEIKQEYIKKNLNPANAIYDPASRSIVVNEKNFNFWIWGPDLTSTLDHEFSHAIDDFQMRERVYYYGTGKEVVGMHLSGNKKFLQLYQEAFDYNKSKNSGSGYFGFVSRYAMSNPMEFFAETHRYYYRTGGNPAQITNDPESQKLIQKQFNYLKTIGAVK